MKIAIPTRNKMVDDHFGHCESYTIYSVSPENDIAGEEIFEAPKGCGCKSNIAAILREKGVEVMLAGNMGQGAVNKIMASGIDIYRGCKGNVREVAEAFLRNDMTDSGETCQHHGHDEGHQCEH